MENSLVEFMGRLLSSREWRQRFAADPSGSARDFGLTGADYLAAAALDCAQLERQALLLTQKRFHEVRRLLPNLFCRLGDTAWPLFSRHCETYWPSGHRRHLDDALAFMAFAESESPRSFVAAELRQLRRMSHGRWWWLPWIDRRQTATI